jgi:hypothetical protein
MPSLLDDPEAYAFAAQVAEDERKKLGLQSLLGGIGGLLEAPVSYVKERATALVTDPIGDMKRTIQGTMDRAKAREQLQQIAYGDPTNPLRVTDQAAADQLAQDYLDMASTIMPMGMVAPKSGLLGGNAFDMSKADASDIFGAGAQKTTYKDPDSGGYIQVLTRPDYPASVLGLEVPEAFRRQGIGGRLQEQAIKDFPNMQGQVSSKAAARSAYKLGRRPVGKPDASLEDVFKMIDDDSSVNLVSPARQKEISETQGGLLSAPQNKALKTAQKNAALPVEEGGLGLPLNNTPEMRAEAMGARDWYHGTDRLDRLTEKKSLDPKRATSGPMPYGTDDVALASNYTNKADTSLFDTGDVPNYFQVSNKDLGRGSRGLTNVEDSYYSLPAEKKKELLDNYYKLGYEDIDQATGKYVLHSGDGSIASKSHLDYILKDSGGNPLKALRQLWHDSGELHGKEEDLAKIFKVAGYPYEITQTNAPWTSAKGVFAGKAMFKNPLETSNTQDLTGKVIPALKEAFKSDRTRLKDYGADMWDKNTRFTPKQWIAELEKDIAEGKNSYVWTSIPDKVTKQLEKLGYDSIIDTSGKGGGTQSNVLIPFKPNQIRSRFAAFDPFKRDEANILAGALPFGLLSADEETKQKMQSLLRY